MLYTDGGEVKSGLRNHSNVSACGSGQW